METGASTVPMCVAFRSSWRRDQSEAFEPHDLKVRCDGRQSEVQSLDPPAFSFLFIVSRSEHETDLG